MPNNPLEMKQQEIQFHSKSRKWPQEVLVGSVQVCLDHRGQTRTMEEDNPDSITQKE